MITDKGLVRYCEHMFEAAPVYLWGGDGEVITKDLIEILKAKFGTRNYTNIDLSIHEGRLGMDCSGSLTNVSGYDSTASGYYSKCLDKGRISKIPTDKVCLVFREEKNKIVHVGVYLGDGRVFEMYNDCELHSFESKKWTYYGIPSWIEYTVEEKSEYPEVPFIIKLKEENLPLYRSASYDQINRFLPGINKYTIVELKNGFGKFKSGAGWFDLNRKYTYEICK